MPSTSETGHAKNVANFQDLISFCAGNASYNPSSVPLTLASLNAKLTAARAALATLTAEQTGFNNAVNNRKIAFEGLKQLSTRVINAFDASGADAEAVKDARTINRKLQGARAAKITKPAADETPGATPPPDNSISVAQLSYDQQIEHLSRFIALLDSSAAYMPNETDLTVAALQSKLANLQGANTAVIDAYTLYSNKRIARNETLYNPVTGLVATAINVKKYVKSVFGATSPQYKQVSGLQFRVVPR